MSEPVNDEIESIKHMIKWLSDVNNVRGKDPGDFECFTDNMVQFITSQTKKSYEQGRNDGIVEYAKAHKDTLTKMELEGK